MLVEKLARAKPCRRCGLEIPSGTPLTALDWDRGARAWAHREPSCEEVRALEAAKGSRAPCPADDPADPAGAPIGPEGSSALGRDSTDPAERGPWSVTVEIHDAGDPALSKRVLRIARLHLGTYAEAREVAEQLRKEV